MRFILPLFCVCLCACAPKQSNKPVTPPASLSQFFDCIRTQDKIVISAHRGGPDPGFAENALASFAHTAKGGFGFLEIDIQSSSDGILFLYHDDALGRTSTGAGMAAAKTWHYLSKQTLKFPNGRGSKQQIPTLEQALIWAKQKNVVLQLDIKRGTKYAPIVQLVRKTKMEQHVVFITYSINQANAIHRLAPKMMISVTIENISDLKNLMRTNIPLNLILAWTGLGQPNPELYARLNQHKIEVIAGTLGRFDRQVAKSGKSYLYKKYVQAGANILATNRVSVVRKTLRKDDNVLKVCPLPK